MYRPKGWEKTLREILDSFDVTYMNSEECKLIEAGANAMLEGLKKDSIHIRTDRGWDDLSDIFTEGDILHYGEKGYLVFIPDVPGQTPGGPAGQGFSTS